MWVIKPGTLDRFWSQRAQRSLCLLGKAGRILSFTLFRLCPTSKDIRKEACAGGSDPCLFRIGCIG